MRLRRRASQVPRVVRRWGEDEYGGLVLSEPCVRYGAQVSALPLLSVNLCFRISRLAVQRREIGYKSLVVGHLQSQGDYV